MRRLAVCAALLLFLIASCSEKPSSNLPDKDGEPGYVKTQIDKAEDVAEQANERHEGF